MGKQPMDLESMTVDEKRAALRRLLEQKAAVSEASDYRSPLSVGQRALWYLYHLSPTSSAYNITFAARILSGGDPQAMRKAFQVIVDRYPVLTGKISEDNGVPVHAMEPGRLDYQVDDLANDESQLSDYVRAQTEQPFDLASGPLFRVRYGRVQGGDDLLLFVAHHMVLDTTSHQIILDTLRDIYQSILDGDTVDTTPVKPSFKEHVLWQQRWLDGEEALGSLSFWRDHLSGANTSLELPTDHPRPAQQSLDGASVSYSFPDSLATNLSTTADRLGVRAFDIIRTSIHLLMSRWSGQNDVVLGIMTSGRVQSEDLRAIGYFVNPVPFRCQVDADQSFADLARHTRRQWEQAFPHQQYPLAKLVWKIDADRDPSRSPIFQVAMDWLKLDQFGQRSVEVDPQRRTLRFDLGSLVLESIEVAQLQGQFDLLFEVYQAQGKIFGVVKYDASLFETETINDIVESWKTILSSALGQPDQPVSELAALSQPQRKLLLDQWNQTGSKYPQERCIHELFEETCDRTPDRVAVIDREREITYRELDELANRIAHRLREVGARPGQLLGICHERCIDMLAGLLGILKTGAAYVPLDPEFPPDRLAYMIEDAGVLCIITSSDLVDLLPGGVMKICLDTEVERQGSVDRLPGTAKSHDLAYVIYTSGSTGKPKGVELEHRGVANFLESMGKHPGIGPGDTLLAVTTISFDISVLELFLPLMVGAKLYIATKAEAIDGTRLIEIINKHGITYLQATPATWQLLLLSGWNTKLPLKALCGGEAMPPSLPERLVPLVDTLFNVYGPTETTIWSTVEQIESRTQTITIGRPIDNTTIYILDDRLKPLPRGVVGELYIGGDGLARGYHGRPELTAQRFINNPFARGQRIYRTGDLARYRLDGKLVILGRVDGQIKLRGHRIELGEIEAVLEKHESVERAVVNVHAVSDHDQRLIAYLVVQDDAVNETSLRETVASQLPAYMAPSSYVWMDDFPMTPNGKVDRKQLEPPMQPGDAGHIVHPEPPENELESDLAGLFEDVLSLDGVGRHDNFYDLGGHSLMSMQVVSRFKKLHGYKLHPQDLVYKTIREIAATCQDHTRDINKPAGVIGRISKIFGRQKRVDPENS